MTTEDPVKSMENTGHIRSTLCSKSGKFPVNIRVVVVREAYPFVWQPKPHTSKGGSGVDWHRFDARHIVNY
jgi:hypothetical protein